MSENFDLSDNPLAMPKKIKLEEFITLIQSLPVGRQKFIIQRRNFQKYELDFLWVKERNHLLFDDNGITEISRNDLIGDYPSQRTLLEIIYWGYPRGMRGNNLELILKSIDLIVKKLIELYENNSLGADDFINFHQWTNGIPGLGISTYSKFLYFYKIRFNGIESLILDQRIIDVFSSESFNDFKDFSNIKRFNAHHYYINYLKKLSELSVHLNTSADNIEQFLFLFGKNIK